uniref:Uncharacterized protein n=1 Tax=Ditylenchus dipsaci TaxID=166011 RepID=A0A915EAW9_9BILA
MRIEDLEHEFSVKILVLTICRSVLESSIFTADDQRWKIQAQDCGDLGCFQRHCKEIALKLAKDGANIVICAKTTTPHEKLPGTIYTAAEEIEKVCGHALPAWLTFVKSNPLARLLSGSQEIWWH